MVVSDKTMEVIAMGEPAIKKALFVKFHELPYVRPDIKRIEAQFNGLLENFDSAGSFEEQDNTMEAINNLRSEFESMAQIASAKIMFEGEERNLPGLIPFMMSTDRSMRKSANEAKYSFFRDNEAKLDEIYDKLVKIRTKIARKLGYKNFTELGYARMNRSDYNPHMVANFRKQVEDFIVPVASRLRERQRRRLGLKKLKYYDEKLNFKGGNAKPEGDPEWIISRGKKMYAELSAETESFFNFMLDNELMDLVSKKGKASGGYCTYISKYKSPFIFSNFNGTSDDIDVLTHEAGHAFKALQGRWKQGVFRVGRNCKFNFAIQRWMC